MLVLFDNSAVTPAGAARLIDSGERDRLAVAAKHVTTVTHGHCEGGGLPG